MKTVRSVSMLLVFLLFLTQGLPAQQKSQLSVNGKNLVIPFATGKIDSSNTVALGRDELMKVEKVMCADKEFEITSFSLVTYVNSKTVVESVKSGNLWTMDIKNILKRRGSGDKFWIENITAKGPDGKAVILRNVVFTIR
jgi:hypothetical protein